MRFSTRVCVPVAVVVAALLGACAGGIPKIPDTPEAVLQKADAYFADGKYFQSGELYKAFGERFGGDARADYAQFQLAESHFNDEQYEVAAVEYQVIVSNYGYSEYVDDALFKRGVCFWRESPSVGRDQQKAFDALGIFNQFLQTFPESPLVPEAHEYIAKIQRKLAEKLIITVRWYTRRKHPRSAMIYCNKIIDNYPDNEYWAEALYLKGCWLLDQGKKDEAAEQFSRALSYPEKFEGRDKAEEKLRETRGG